MTIGRYAAANEAFLRGEIAFQTDNIKAVLCSSAYTINLATHTSLADIDAGARIATSANLSGKTTTGGVADCADVVFDDVSGSAIASYVIYKDTGVEATSTLICAEDEAVGLPLTPTGQDISLQVSSGVHKLFAL